MAILITAPVWSQDAKKPVPDAKKPAAPKIDAVAARAHEKARCEDEQEFLRMTVFTQNGSEVLTALCEFRSGDLGVFSGELDPSLDQWVIIEHKKLEILQETCERLRKR